MKSLRAIGIPLMVLQALAVLPHVSASGMLVEFAQNIVTDWNELLASESDSRFNRTQKLLALDDGTTDADIIDATVVIGQLRGPNEPSDASTVATSLLFAESTNLRTSDEDVLPEVMLMANNPSTQQTLPSTTVSPPSPTTCSYTGTVSTGSPVTVLIAISSCWSEVGFPKIEDWITTLECQDSLYFQGSTANKMVYLRRTIDDGCNKPSNAPPYLTQADPTPIAVISIMVYATGANRVQTYVTSNNVPTFLKYVYYNSPGYVTPIAGYQAIPYRCENGATLMTAIDPFYVSRSIHCKDMPGGIPTSYIDGSGKRQCFCGCQQGYELKGSQCMPVQDQACQCSWDKVTNGFKFEVKLDQPSSYLSPSNTCVIKNLALTSTSGLIPVPVARDNYVDHNNVNDKDLTLPISATAPHIDVKKQKATVSVKQGSSGTTGTETGDAMYSTSSYTWKDYQSSSIAKINSIEFNYVGKYNIELFAKDYSNAATCDGCVAVVDSRRPTANPNYQCPIAVNSVATDLTTANLGKAQTAVDAVNSYKSNALNDPCSPNVRCDDDCLRLKKFTETSYGATAASLAGTSGWFSTSAVKADLTARLTLTPFDSTKANGLATTVSETCTRCASVSTQLREWWTPYSCSPSATTPFLSQCDGLDITKCSIEQCVIVKGKTIATASASLTDSVKSTSKTVVKQINNDQSASDSDLTAKYSLDSTVHVALECSSFTPISSAYSLLATDGDDQVTPEVCSYTAKLTDLIKTAADRAVATSDFLYTSEEAKGYVFWRYNVDSGAWKSWTAIAQETFAKASTSITVEAWTQCGKVEAFTFKVELHLNNIIRVCDHFDDMWYQMTTAPQFLTNQQFCLFPKSDFAEITFDYHPNIGIDFDVNKFQMSVSSVTCTLSYDGKKPVTIVDSNGLTSFEIVRQFAVNAVDVTTTKDHTVVSVSCDFTYVRKVDDKKVLQKCGQSFTLTDCEAPVFNRPCELDGKCNFNKCAQKTGPTDPRPDLYQACGGNRISQDTLGNTAFTTTDSTCCDSCDTTTYSTACVPISTFPTGAIPGSKYVKRCDAIPKASTPLLAVADMDAEKTQGASTTNVAAVLSASALVALVAMIVIKRRRTEAIKVEQDAYYPLMG